MARAMRKEGDKEIKNLSESLYKIFKFLKMIKREGKDFEDGKCIGDIDG